MKGYWLATVEANWRIIFKFADGDKKLERDGAIELLVDGFVDDTIPPSPSFSRIS